MIATSRKTSSGWAIVVGTSCNGGPLFAADVFGYKVTGRLEYAFCRTWDDWGDTRNRCYDYGNADYPTDRVWTGGIPYNRHGRQTVLLPSELERPAIGNNSGK